MLTAKEAREMADNFNRQVTMPEVYIDAKFKEFLEDIIGEAKLGNYHTGMHPDCCWNYSDRFTLEQKKHGRKELRKRLTEAGYKITDSGFFSFGKVSW